MKVVTIDKIDESVNFEKAHKIADEKARSELGDCINIAYYNDDLNLVSPTLVACSSEVNEDCGAESYAKSYNAQLAINVTERYTFYYRQVRKYLS